MTEDRKITGLNLVASISDNIAVVAIRKLLSGGLYSKRRPARRPRSTLKS